jgi:hypothetical protein
MAGKANGLAPLPANLLRPTTPPDAEDSALSAESEASEPTPAEGQGRGGDARPAKARRTRRPAVSTETKGRKLHLPDDIHDRLWMLAHQRRTTVSAIAAEILDRNLPRWRVEREG